MTVNNLIYRLPAPFFWYIIIHIIIIPVVMKMCYALETSSCFMLFNDVSHVSAWRWIPERTTLGVHRNLATLPPAERHCGDLSVGHSRYQSSRVSS